VQAFTDLAAAAYCPRQLYYRRRDDPDADRDARHELAFRYRELLAPETDLSDEPIAVTPTAYRRNLGCVRARLEEATFDALCDPPARDVFLAGRDARGVAHKLLEAPPRPSVVVAGTPPERGVYASQAVRATAAALALARERGQRIESAFVEYATHGVVRRVRLGARRRGQYRRALGTARSIDGPPPRIDDDAKCRACEYREECGVRTCSLRSRL
jgi:CRISPR-associated exonuclease Cas4